MKKTTVVTFPTGNKVVQTSGGPASGNPVADALIAYRPKDFFEGFGYRNYKLIDLTLDENTLEVVGVFEIAISTGYDQKTVYTCEYKMIDGKPVRCHEYDPADMDDDAYQDLVDSRK